MSDVGLIGVIMLVILALLGVIVSLGMWGDAVACGQKWPDKFEPRWSIMTGCTIVGSDGVRVPAENYRVF